MGTDLFLYFQYPNFNIYSQLTCAWRISILVIESDCQIEAPFGPGSEFGFEKLMPFFNLLALFVKLVVASIYAATSKPSQSFSGFSQTFSGRFQSLVPCVQRMGFIALAAS